jgi:pseudouridine kinase
MKGYLVCEENFVTVVGAVNVDISGTPAAPLVNHDSNPGRIAVTYGGVGRNIAENIARLGLAVEFITVLGDDGHAATIREHSGRRGIGLEHALSATGRNTSSYLCINDERGEMLVAVNDMGIYDLLTPEYLQTKLAMINQGDLLVLDANLTPEAIAWLAHHCMVPILAEPVSTQKALKFLPVLDKLFLIKPNRLEASALSGVKIENEQDLNQAADILLAKGIKHLFISLASEGVFYAGQERRRHFSNFPGQIINTTGCGDAFMAACAWGILQGFGLERTARAGLAAAAICAASPGAISPDLTPENILKMEAAL